MFSDCPSVCLSVRVSRKFVNMNGLREFHQIYYFDAVGTL